MQVTASIDIDAPAELVWKILTAFSAYPEWNPLTHRIVGVAAPGAAIDVFVRPGAREMRSTNTIVVLRPNREICWCSVVGHRRILDVYRQQEIEPLGDGGVRFHTRETLDGALAALVSWLYRHNIEERTHCLARNLKERAERAAQAELSRRCVS